MSTAGIRSNRGDGYQTLVAFDWALTVLSDPDYQWIEVDSILYSVDDVVIARTDGTLICCQCKKNQTDFKYWTVANLSDELGKAANLLANNNNAQVRFYSRSPFDALTKLREYSTSHADEQSYKVNLTSEHKKTDSELADVLSKYTPNLSTYAFLCRTKFEVSPELDRLETLLYERLRFMTSNSKAAYNALWTQIDKLGARLDDSLSASSQHRLTKEDLKAILQQAGSMLTPSMDITEVCTLFASTSAIGRSWNREIAGQQIDIPIVKKLLVAIDTGIRSILLTGLPGSGKTCAILALQDILEQQANTDRNLATLFIQAREFADLATAQARQAQGLAEQWVEQAARVAEQMHVIIVIDSLDVLSIAREHSVLTYFLAQIDRLLLIPNITIVTACRDFDRRYDYRIAKRQWDFELQCPPLDWESQVYPLLASFSISTESIDKVTRELIKNPRELALFVELAQKKGSFNVVTSQALAQQYLNTIIRSDNSLGEAAIQAIEKIANEMLMSRSLTIHRQRFIASEDILRKLYSLNILQNTQDNKLTFGHQTLLDVLVISRAIRQNITLNNFIQNLPPVPFVRPSIRSFVAQLATEERSKFRKQLRAVLTGNSAFHIRRLVAESLAEQIPHDEDWPLLRDLYYKYREVFQVIYTQGRLIDWHYFWLQHLLPILKDSQDTEGLTSHLHRVSQWKNENTQSVVKLWEEALTLDWLDNSSLAHRLGSYLAEIRDDNINLVIPLLKKILSFPRQKHSFLGHAVARCVAIGVLADEYLWDYVVGEVSHEDIQSKIDTKLRCRPHEFGNANENFLYKRLENSVKLLSLSLDTIENWSKVISLYRHSTQKSFYNVFLYDSSYNETHSKHDEDLNYLNDLNILLKGMEKSILNHASENSDWLKNNRERLCWSHESVLRYFAILAFTANPQNNINLIKSILCKKDMLESNLSYELGTLIKAAFIYLDDFSQDEVITCILSIWDEDNEDWQSNPWILRKRSELLITLPSHLLPTEAKSLLDTYKKLEGDLIRQPDIRLRSGTISAPFSFDVFLDIGDRTVINLLNHYSEYNRDFDDWFIGGKQEVGWQLNEAASRQPMRFLLLLKAYWNDIPEYFRDELMRGVTNYLAYRYGNLHSNKEWAAVETPYAPTLAIHIIDELERHSTHWHHSRFASAALKYCAYVIQNLEDAERLVFISIGFFNLQEEGNISTNTDELLTTGINMVVGEITESLMILANRFLEINIPFPSLLTPTLQRFAGHAHPAIRALVLQRLPYLQSKKPELGWDLFQRAMQNSTGLWKISEGCLYYSYRNNFEAVALILDRIKHEGNHSDMETLGRISALAALSNLIDFPNLSDNLKVWDVTEAWMGAVNVWINPNNASRFQDQCFSGIEIALEASRHPQRVAQMSEKLFRNNQPIISVPIKLIQKIFTTLEKDNEEKHHHFYDFSEWLNLISQRDPDLAISATEIYLAYVKRTKPYFHDHNNSLSQLITRLFAEAEEREESDGGVMLQSVVLIQDTLLSLGVSSINDWLKAAERP